MEEQIERALRINVVVQRNGVHLDAVALRVLDKALHALLGQLLGRQGVPHTQRTLAHSDDHPVKIACDCGDLVYFNSVASRAREELPRQRR